MSFSWIIILNIFYKVILVLKRWEHRTDFYCNVICCASREVIAETDLTMQASPAYIPDSLVESKSLLTHALCQKCCHPCQTLYTHSLRSHCRCHCCPFIEQVVLCAFCENSMNFLMAKGWMCRTQCKGKFFIMIMNFLRIEILCFL